MSMQLFQLIESWIEDDLLSLPGEESDLYEYKSSRTPIDKLKEKIAIAASAFWNSGGGIFVAGVDDMGKIDGGIPTTIGRQKVRDWVDQVLANVEPIGPYTINIIQKSSPTSRILDHNAVLVIGFGESNNPPHMAPDRKYYLRVGAHSGAATHFLVEAIRSRRGIQSPMLRAVFRNHEHKPGIVQLVIMNVNNAAA